MSKRVEYRTVVAVWSLVAIATFSSCLMESIARDTTQNMSQIQSSYKKMGGQPQILTEWQVMLQNANGLPLTEKLKTVNEFFNRHLAFAENREVWASEDYWATPLESLLKERADCKGYVIAKYYALLN